MFKDEYKRTFSSVRPSKEFDPEEIYMKANKKHTPIGRMVSVAVAAALILALSLTAYATELFGVMDFIMPEDYQSGGLPADAADNASDRQTISISGFTDSSEAKGAAEWDRYYRDYILNNDIAYEEDELPLYASYYGAYNNEMFAKLNEIADKYGLALVNEEGFAIGERHSHTIGGADCTYYQYGNGNFKEEGDFTASDGVTVGYSIIRTVKGSLATSGFEIWDAENWIYWNHTTSEGAPVAVGMSDTLYDMYGSDIGKRGLIMVDLGDCFVTVVVIDWNKEVTETAMQELAENLDYARLATIE